MCDDELARPAWAATDPLMRAYYDTEWGMPVTDEQGLFERIALESFQSGLSWATVLRKRDAFRAAFDDFDPDAVAEYGEFEIERLVTDPGIIRNRKKIEATIANARATVALRDDGGLPAFVWRFRPVRTPMPIEYDDVPWASVESTLLTVELKQRGFSWVGPTSMFALMEAIGIVDTNLVGTHRRGASGLWDAEGLPIAEAWAAMPGGGERWAGLPIPEADETA